MKEDNQTSKKSSVKIDAGAFIRQVAVAGSNEDTPKPIQTDNQPEVIENSNEPEDTTGEKPKESPKKKRGQSIDYETAFLIRNELRNRQGLYIDKDNYEVLQTLVRSIRNERLSVSGLVDNIIRHHIELYEDDINHIYEENIKRPIKKNSK
jgi:Protein of unknown function (DUF3408).